MGTETLGSSGSDSIASWEILSYVEKTFIFKFKNICPCITGNKHLWGIFIGYTLCERLYVRPTCSFASSHPH